MRPTLKPWTRPLLTVTPILSLLCLAGCLTTRPPLAATAAPPTPVVKVIPADKVVTRLPDGNYEVTPAWLQERYRLESWQAAEINRLRGK